jgi:2-iminobutanoate/2-iminopropanoate deaminase
MLWMTWLDGGSMKAFFLLPAVVPALLVSACGADEEEVRTILHEELGRMHERSIVDPVQTIGPYSPAVRAGGFLFVSGQIGIDQTTGTLVDTGIAGETQKALENLYAVLRVAGYDSSHVVSTTVYLSNMEDYALMNQIYGGYFGEGNYPARSTVAVAALPRGASVEIAAIAFKGGE